MSVVEVHDLRVSFRGGPPVVDGVSFSIQAGEVLALVGESGSGKSVTARSLLRLAGPGSRTEAAALRVAGIDVPAAGSRELRRLRGGGAGLVAQDALVSLDPLRPVGREIADTLRLHTGLDRRQRERRVIELLQRAGVPDAAVRSGQRAGELSGGLRQRALIAGAIAAGPPLLIADEPTTALDATVAAGVLDLFRELADSGAAVLLITHDLAVVERIADRVLVMRAGRVLEQGTPSEVIGSPREEYTRRLVQAVPTDRPRGTRLSPGADPSTSAEVGASAAAVEPSRASDPSPDRLPGPAAPVVLSAEHLRATFAVGAGRRHLAVDDVGLRLRAGQTLGVVGESGSGKTTLVRLLLGLQRPEAGTVELEGELFAPGPESLRAARRARLGWIAQDALDSLDGRWTVGRTLADALTHGRTTRPAAVADRIDALLASVELDPALRHRRPRSLSGGQRQRVAIARAIAQDPAVLIADEPVSSLDVSVQAEVLDLLDRLQRERGLAILLVSHDLGVIRHSSDEVLVLERGRVVESGPTEQIFRHPEHPATRALVAAAPRLRGLPA